MKGKSVKKCLIIMILDLSNKIINDKSKIFLFDNIEGKDLFNLIDYSNNIISFHGMMTNLGSLNHKKLLICGL